MPLRSFVLLVVLTLPLAAASQSPVPDGAVPVRIAQGFQFTEGPLWFEGALLFSDIPANTIYRWTPDRGAEVFLRPSDKSNGLALDAEGGLLIAHHASRSVTRRAGGGSPVVETLASAYGGNRLNSPNDIAVHPDGSVYFTDPTWGLEGRPAELGFTGVYRLDPEGALHLLADSLHQPNGLAFSPDLATLYVSTSNERTVVAYDLGSDHALSNGRVFARLTGGTPSDAADGMEVDADGNLWVAGPRGVWVFAPDGAVLGVIDVPGQTTNVAWGDADGETLYITSGPGVYRLRVGPAPTGTRAAPSAPSLQVSLAAPNPASGVTTLTYRLDAPGAVALTLVDALGRPVRTLEAGPRASGEHRLHVDLGGLPAGLYTVRLASAGETVTRRLTLVR